MLSKKTFEVSFSFRQDTPVAREILRNRLCAVGVASSLFVEKEEKGRFSLSVYCQDRSEAGRISLAFGKRGARNVRVELRLHREEDWANRWKKGWKPFSLTGRLQVIPLWQNDRRCPKGKAPVYLDTTNAFGTGLHETTRFSAKLINGLKGRFASFLDVGTGSGILLVVADKSGARILEGFDIDGSAVKVARANLKVNGVRRAKVYTADVNGPGSKRTFDLVAANLVTQDLIAFKKKIWPLVAKGGYLVVSGISMKNLCMFRRDFKHASMKCIKIVRGQEWAALLFRKGEGCVRED